MNYYLQVFTSETLNKMVHQTSGHFLTFSVTMSTQPQTVGTRLNKGWDERREDNPRCGTTSEPLALCTDWKRQLKWDVDCQAMSFREDRWFKTTFDKAPILATISKEILAKDNEKFPDLKGWQLPLNGLEQLFSLRNSDAEAILGRTLPASWDELSDDELGKLLDFVRRKIEGYLTAKNIDYIFVA